MSVKPVIQRYMAQQGGIELPAFNPGDTVRVHVRIKEGDKERVQAFEGVCIARSSKGMRGTFTVRKISFGQGVERIFPVNSRVLDKVELVRSGRVRRAKLYYLRGLRGKAARIREVETETVKEARAKKPRTAAKPAAKSASKTASKAKAKIKSKA